MATQKKSKGKVLSRRKVLYGAEVLKQDPNGKWAYTNFFKLTEKEEGVTYGTWIDDSYLKPKGGNTLPYFEPNCTYLLYVEVKKLLDTEKTEGDNKSDTVVYTLIGEPEPFRMSKDSNKPIEDKE